MSILKKPYEISVWVDELEDGKYVEKRLGIIGTHTMTAQNRAIKPTLSRNVNGVKKLSFSMYKRYVDNITGEWMDNPFSDWLINERKVKLKYGKNPDGTDIWYDFIIKDVGENSTDYLFTYQLEDALVQELSKNGFGVVLDEKVRDESGKSNMGTAKQLAEKVLAETDWNVESEIFVQTVEEDLIYITIPSGTIVQQVIDPSNSSSGVTTREVTIGGEALAFYSCCKNKPYRFQFIYLPGGYGSKDAKISRDENRVINIQNCQYYFDVFANGKDYSESINSNYKNYYLPTGWAIEDKGNQGIDDTYDTTISNWYRGARYGFAQDAEYVPLLDRYCNKFYPKGVAHEPENEVYGYIDNIYNSPALVQNVITNTEFKHTSGWVGTYNGQTPNAKNNYGITVEPVYGHFVGGTFSSVVKELQDGTYNSETKYTSYLKIDVPAGTQLDTPILINTGFYDNRVTIDSVGYDEKWVFKHKILTSSGGIASGFDFKLREVRYDSNAGDYNLGDIWAKQEGNFLQFNSATNKTGGYADVQISSTEFRKKEIKLVIIPPGSPVTKATYYLESLELYKAIPTSPGGTTYIEPGKLEENGVITTTYNFFTQEALNSAEKKEDIVFNKKAENDWYDSYVPKFNVGAEKVRSVTAKESNYFNILQQIAEAFEVWLGLEVTRDSVGGVLTKTVRFKKYAGNENHAAFRYGVNLKNIQRTHASNNIVTKLVVKQNSNEHAQNGFCTIQRAGANPTGENYIYDFRHFHENGLMDAKDYVGLVYGNGGVGPDLGGTEEDCNLIGYNSRIKDLNDSIISLDDDIATYSEDLTKLNAERAVEENLVEAGQSELEKVREDFELLTGLSIENISPSDFDNIEISPPSNEKPAIEITTTYDWAEGATITYSKRSLTDWVFQAKLQETQLGDSDLPLEIEEYPKDSDKVDWGNGTLKLTKDQAVSSDRWLGLRVNLIGGYQEGVRYRLSFVISNITGTLNRIGGHNASFANPTIKIWYEGYKNKDNPDVQISNHNVLAVEPKTSYYVEFEGTYYKNSVDIASKTSTWFIQPNRHGYDSVICNITNIEMFKYEKNLYTKARTLNFNVNFKLTPKLGEASESIKKLSCSIPAYDTNGTLNYTFNIVDLENAKVASLLTEYATLRAQINQSNDKLQGTSGIIAAVERKENQIKEKEEQRNTLRNYKKILNKLFYTRFSRFIQEGTWVSEEHVDDDKYYNDALSVIYNSCRPQVAYSINVIELSSIPGYEMFTYELGDRTYAIDPDFFGDEGPRSIIISEISENFDDPNQNVIKAQNYKDQFKDLFQKITATVQQAQYSTGAYEKAVALAEADAEIKGDFLQSALGRATAKLSVGGQDTVLQDDSGITITNSVTKDQMRLVGGAILLSSQNEETGERTWKTGLTPEGISASLVTAGTINAGDISIMNVNEPVFRWDSFGLTAFDAEWGGSSIVGRPNKNKFVRFDKHGIYGINNDGGVVVDGLSWKPSSIDEIDEKATFALTWEGLKVTKEYQTTSKDGKTTQKTATVRIGNYNWIEGTGANAVTKDAMIKVNDGDKDTFIVDQHGNVTVRGSLDVNTSNFSWKFDKTDGMMMWNGLQGTGEIDKNDDGTYKDPHLVFKINNDKLYMRGSGEFSGTISASTIIGSTIRNDTNGSAFDFSSDGGTIAGWKINNGYFGTQSAVYNDYQNRWNNLETNAGVRLDQKYFRQANRIPTSNLDPLTDSFTISWSGQLGTYNSSTAESNRQSRLPYFFLGNYHYQEDKEKTSDTTYNPTYITYYTTKKSNLFWTPEEFVIQRIATPVWDNSINPETSLTQECRETPIWLKFSKEGLKIHTPTHDIVNIQGEQESSSIAHGWLINDEAIKFEWSDDSKSLFTIKGLQSNNPTFILSQDTYLSDNEDTTLANRLTNLDIRLDNLGFKKPYTIKLKGKDVGKIFQLGTIVYGYLIPQILNDVTLTADTFTFYDGSTQKTLDGPFAAAQFLWSACAWIETSLILEGVTYMGRVSLENESGNLSMKFNGGTPLNQGINATDASRWTYFCYSTSDSLGQHPD